MNDSQERGYPGWGEMSGSPGRGADYNRQQEYDPPQTYYNGDTRGRDTNAHTPRYPTNQYPTNVRTLQQTPGRPNYSGSREGFAPGNQRHPSGPHRGGQATGGMYRPVQTDVKELLKREAFGSQSGADDDHFEKNRPGPHSTWGISDQYVILDSFQKTEDSNTKQGELNFNFMIQGVTANQRIGVKDKIDTVIEIEVAPFCIPLLKTIPYITNDPREISSLPLLVENSGDPGGGSLDSPLTQLPYCGRVTLEFKQLSLQSYSDDRGVRHHFEFESSMAPTGDRLLLRPLRRFEKYTFTDPIKDIHGLTAIFRNPDIPINFSPDCYYEVTVSISQTPDNFLQFNIINHCLEENDRIIIKKFKSGDQVVDRYINRMEGLIIGSGGLTTDSFRLNPDVGVEQLGNPGDRIAANTRIVVCVMRNRIRIPLRMRRVIQRLTNYLTPLS